MAYFQTIEKYKPSRKEKEAELIAMIHKLRNKNREMKKFFKKKNLWEKYKKKKRT
jgi:hypothetical protein